jgi:hypothetical protein
MNALESVKVGKYGCKISKSPNNPTTRQANADLLVNLGKIFPEVIPPQIIIEQSDIPKKDEVLEYIKQRQEQADKIQQIQAQAEVAKNQPQKRTLQKR